MDINLTRTFIEIADSGSFVGAAHRLNVTQSTVSARIRNLEDQLGRRLFVRKKSGAVLTPAGEQFQRYALTMVHVWEQARHHIAMPLGYEEILSIGGQVSLWDGLLTKWLAWMRNAAPEVSIQAEYGLPDMDINLTRTFIEIADSGSFVGAAHRLNVTQSTVSARIRNLEDQLGRRLFVRKKSGAVLTPAGEQFQRYALTMVHVWEQARHHIAMPLGYEEILSIGGQVSLWDRIGEAHLFPHLFAGGQPPRSFRKAINGLRNERGGCPNARRPKLTPPSCLPIRCAA